MAAASGTQSSGDERPRLSGARPRDGGLRLLAAFPDVNRVSEDRPAHAVSLAAASGGDERRAIPRIGWGSIAILAMVAAAACTSAWWIDRGPIDPGAVEIERVRLAERAAGGRAESPNRTIIKR